MNERAEYIKIALWYANRYSAYADVFDEFGFDQLAYESRAMAGDFYERVAQAKATLGIEGLLL